MEKNSKKNELDEGKNQPFREVLKQLWKNMVFRRVKFLKKKTKTYWP